MSTVYECVHCSEYTKVINMTWGAAVCEYIVVVAISSCCGEKYYFAVLVWRQ